MTEYYLECLDLNGVVHSNLGKSYFALDWNIDAIKHFWNSLRYKKHNVRTYLALARVYEKLSNYSKAIDILNEGIKVFKKSGNNSFVSMLEETISKYKDHIPA